MERNGIGVEGKKDNNNDGVLLDASVVVCGRYSVLGGQPLLWHPLLVRWLARCDFLVDWKGATAGVQRKFV